MPFERPTLADLVSRVRADLAWRLGSPIASLSHRPELALANCVAAVADGLYAHLDWVARQLLPDQCDEAALIRWATLLGVARKTDEPLADFRARVLDAIRTPSLGGAQGDWSRWALEVDGVKKAWEIPNWIGPGSVGVLISAADSDSAVAASDALVAACQAHLDEVGPCFVSAIVRAPTLRHIDLRLQLEPNTPEVQDAVRDALHALIAANGRPGSSLLLSQLRGAIATARGVVDHRVHLPFSDLSIGRAQIPVLGTVEFTPF